VFELFHELNNEGITVVLVTHERDFAYFAQRIIELKDGAIIRDYRIEASLNAKEELEKLKNTELSKV
jgi:ABC-type lipoprotein export system ATPase subunit